MNFAVLWLFVKVLSVKFGGVASFGVGKVSNLRKFSLRNCILHQFAKVSHYTVANLLISLISGQGEGCK